MKLSLRLATPTLKNAIALDVTVDNEQWELVNKSLRYYAKAYRRGADFEVDGGLKSKLWSVLKAVDALYEADELTLDGARAVVRRMLRSEALKEVARLHEERKAERHSPTLTEWVGEFIGQCESGERLKRKGTKCVSAGTIKSWKGTLAKLKEYEAWSHQTLSFDDMTFDFYDDWKGFFIKKKYSPNTIGRHVKTLKIFLNAARDMKLTTTTDFLSRRFSADFVEVDNVYLTEERVQEMYDFNPTDDEQLKERLRHFNGAELQELTESTERENSRKALEMSKDVFLIGCMTGQRFSDYSRIGDGMFCVLRDGNEYIRITQKKTEKDIYLPLDSRVRVILSKYGGKVPKVYDTKVNKHIKIVGHLLGWTETSGITERHGVMEVKSRKKFYECIKTHTARRTFATNAYRRGVSLSSIMAVTGHSTELMLRKYLKLDNEERAIMAAAEFARVKEAM